MESGSNPSEMAFNPPEANDYDSFADAYAAENEASLNNAYYERPAILRLAGEVRGSAGARRRLWIRATVRSACAIEAQS